jgi:RNA polymerase sigma factor (sigma-70 family)
MSQAIEQHLPLAEKIARTAYHRYGRNYEHDDLVGYAHVGLCRAAAKYAVMEYDIRQTIDFGDFAEKRIWDSIEVGRDRMSRIHRDHYRKIKRGEMPAVKFVHDSETYTMAEAIAVNEGDDLDIADAAQAEMMIAWLRGQNEEWANVVHLHLHEGMTFEQISARTGGSRSAADSQYRRAIKILRWKFNPAAHVADDRTARRHRALAKLGLTVGSHGGKRAGAGRRPRPQAA